ncbi:MAG TPA: LysE family transporter [Actinocrinis sp.]|uniref:LysE family transporter n=1 Tax=Actinocrinis sp. TaxID=1920516 RepID=UPI002D6081D3|nr:LysE family transporter [Actinocrinis sp.]HZU59120.1 LysE family transporter [Actinocrinis sp.]
MPEYVAGAGLIILLPGPNSLYVLSVAARRGVRTGYRAACGVFLGDSTLIMLTSLGAASLLTRSPLAFGAVKYLGAAYLAVLGVGMLRSAVRSLRQRRAQLREARDSGGAQDSGTQDSGTQDGGTQDGGTQGNGAKEDAVLARTMHAAVHPDAAASQAADASGAEPETGAGANAGERPFRRALVVSLLNPKAILFFLAFFTQFVDPAYPHPVVPFAVLAVIIQAFSVLYLSALILGGDRLASALRRRRRLASCMTGGVGTLFLGFAAKLATATLH